MQGYPRMLSLLRLLHERHGMCTCNVPSSCVYEVALVACATYCVGVVGVLSSDADFVHCVYLQLLFSQDQAPGVSSCGLHEEVH